MVLLLIEGFGIVLDLGVLGTFRLVKTGCVRIGNVGAPEC